MKKICIYGKGGIGKSTTVANIAAALALKGHKVSVVGCDPKADSTRNLMGGKMPTILDILHQKKEGPLCQIGFQGIRCMESGGPLPATGCAGRGIVVALSEIQKKDLLADSEVVIYDVLGDVVCGGFATPLRENIADEVYIVSTSDFMSLYAANNICKGIQKYAKTGSVRLSGIIHNGRSSQENGALMAEFAKGLGTQILGFIPMSVEITKAEILKKTVIEQFPEAEISQVFKALGEAIWENQGGVVPTPLGEEELERLCQNHLNIF